MVIRLNVRYHFESRKFHYCTEVTAKIMRRHKPTKNCSNIIQLVLNSFLKCVATTNPLRLTFVAKKSYTFNDYRQKLLITFTIKKLRYCLESTIGSCYFNITPICWFFRDYCMECENCISYRRATASTIKKFLFRTSEYQKCLLYPAESCTSANIYNSKSYHLFHLCMVLAKNSKRQQKRRNGPSYN